MKKIVLCSFVLLLCLVFNLWAGGGSQSGPARTANSTPKVIIGELSGGSIVAQPEEGVSGTQITLTVTPDRGYRLKADSIQYSNTRVVGDPPGFTMPASDVVVTAEFVKADFVLANGTGYTIKSIEVRPSARAYPKNDQVFSISNIPDKGFVEIFLGEGMTHCTSFDLSIQYDSDVRDNRERLKRVRTREAISLISSNGVPVFSLSIKGEKNTLANLGAGVAAGASVHLVAAVVVSAIVGAPVVLIGGAVGTAAAVLAGGLVTAFGPFVSQDLIAEEIGDYTRW